MGVPPPSPGVKFTCSAKKATCLVYLCPIEKKCDLCSVFYVVGQLKTVLLKLCVSLIYAMKMLDRKPRLSLCLSWYRGFVLILLSINWKEH